MDFTNGPDAHTYVIYAKQISVLGRLALPRLSLKRLPGFSRHKARQAGACAGRIPAELVFQDCEVPEEICAGELKGAAANVPDVRLDYERTVLSGGPVGIMQAPVWMW